MIQIPNDIICPNCHDDRQLEIANEYKPIMVNGKITQTLLILCNTCSKQFVIELIK